MSDRIDELVDAVNKMTFTMADTWFDGSDVDASARFAAKDAVMETVTELATIARKAEADRDALLATTEAAYFLLNSDQCTHGGDDWNDPECRVCNLRRAFDALPHDVRDRLASMTYAERVIRG